MRSQTADSPHFLNDLRSVFQERRESPALVHRGRTWTYGQLDEQARRFAAGLQRHGIARGDRVPIVTAEKLPFLFAHLGVMYAGAAPIPLNPRYTRDELRYFLTDSEARCVVAGGSQRALLEDLAREVPKTPVVLPDVGSEESTTEPFHEPAVDAADPCLILYSSGTTGWPKGVVHSHAGAAGALRSLAACWRMTPDDVVVNVLPLFHIHGLAFATHLTWLTGGCLCVEDAFEPEKTLAAIGQSTVFMSVPSIYYRLLDSAEFRSAAAGWSRVRLFTCGSAPIRPEVLPLLEEILGRPVINRYGMTESYVITSLPLAGPWPTGSVGLPLPGVELEVVDAEGRETPVGEVGTVRIRSGHLFREYLGKPEETRAAFAGGWFDTGDLGTLDAAGFLTLVGRKNDLIITSGYNVYPQVVERVLNECPGVAECAVLGLPDSERGERVAAAVVCNNPDLDEQGLRGWIQDRLIHYQQPKTIVFVREIPRNTLGKVLRRELRDQLCRPDSRARG